MNVSENILAKPVQAFFHKEYQSIVVIRADNTREFVPIKSPLRSCASLTIQEITITNGVIHNEYDLYPHSVSESPVPDGTIVYNITDVCAGARIGEECSCKKTFSTNFGLNVETDSKEVVEYARVTLSRLPVEFL